jgi:hypothetical protein
MLSCLLHFLGCNLRVFGLHARLLILKLLQVLLPLRYLVIELNLLGDRVLLVVRDLMCQLVQVTDQLLLPVLEASVCRLERVVAREDVVKLLELVLVLLLHALEEPLELLHRLDLALYVRRLLVERLLRLYAPLLLLGLLLDLLLLYPVQLGVLLAAHFVRLQERAELDQVVLYQDVFLTQLCLALLEILLLLSELFLLVLEGLLYLVHGPTLLEEARGWGHAVQLKVLGQLDLLIHFDGCFNLKLYLFINEGNQSAIPVSQGGDPRAILLHSKVLFVLISG